MWCSIAPVKSCSASSRRRRISVWAARIVVGVARAGAAAELEALAREPLRVLDAARHLRPHHLPADREVADRAAGAGRWRASRGGGARRAPRPRARPRAGRRCASGGRAPRAPARPARPRAPSSSSDSRSRSSTWSMCRSALRRDSSAASARAGRRAARPSRAPPRSASRGAPRSPANCSRSTSRARSWTAIRWSVLKRARAVSSRARPSWSITPASVWRPAKPSAACANVSSSCACSAAALNVARKPAGRPRAAHRAERRA